MVVSIAAMVYNSPYMSDDGDSWSYVSDDNRRLGPIPRDALLALMAQGRLSKDTLVWRPGFEEWRKAGEVEELGLSGAPPPSGPSANILTERLAPLGIGESAAAAPGANPKTQRILKITAAIAVLCCVAWANDMWRFLPFSPKPSSEYATDLPDRWFSPNKREGVIIQCSRFESKGAGGGKRRFRLAIVVSAGNAQNNRLPVDRSKSLCNVVLKNADGKTVFDKDITTHKLCPS